MYGLLVENVLRFLRSNSHPKVFDDIRRSAQLPFEDVDVLAQYPENLVSKIVKKASLILQMTDQEILEGVGISFVDLYRVLGYRQTVACIAREFREFILNLDNCHDYFKLTFPKMRAPSFFIENEHEKGLTLLYRSKRRGFTYYVVGQMKELALTLFNFHLKVEVHRHEIVFDTVVVSFKLEFDNSAFTRNQAALALRNESSMPIKAHVIFEVFPFSILFNDKLIITLIGSSLRKIMPQIVGKPLTECFSLVRPLVECTAEQLLQRCNNVFVLKALFHVPREARMSEIKLMLDQEPREPRSDGADEDDRDYLQIKGQLMYMPMWKRILFFGCPTIDDLKNLVNCGLCMNDLSLDYSRDIMISSTQTKMEERMTKMLLDKNNGMLENMSQRRNSLARQQNQLKASWIPSSLLLGGAGDSFKVESVAFGCVLVVAIDRIDLLCAKSDPLDLIDLIDNIANVMDHLAVDAGVLTVEAQVGVNNFVVLTDFTTTTDRDENYERRTTEVMCTMALDLENAAKAAFREPVLRRKPVKFHIAVASGPFMAAAVGAHLAKFCAFGETVSAAEAMLDRCPAGSTLVTARVRDALPSSFRTTPVHDINDQQIFFLGEKEDYTPVSVFPILHAYTAFKAAKTKRRKSEMERLQRLTQEAREADVVAGAPLARPLSDVVRSSRQLSEEVEKQMAKSCVCALM